MSTQDPAIEHWWSSLLIASNISSSDYKMPALGRPRGIGWRGRWDGGSGWGIHVYPWLIHVNV